jgi:hypothetical protein
MVFRHPILSFLALDPSLITLIENPRGNETAHLMSGGKLSDTSRTKYHGVVFLTHQSIGTRNSTTDSIVVHREYAALLHTYCR